MDRTHQSLGGLHPGRPDRPTKPAPRRTPPGRALGNQRLKHLLDQGVIRARRRVGTPDDPLEREADRVAEAIASSAEAPPVQRHCTCGTGVPCTECQAPPVLRKAHGRHQTGAGRDPAVASVTGRSGRPLDTGSRHYFEGRFGRDFSGVRVHTDARAAESADALSAEAYTVGSNIVFARNRYDPDTPAGRWLLAHELTHVVQQGRQVSNARAQRFGEEGQSYTVSVPYSVGEIELAGGETVTVIRWEDDSPTARVQLPAPYVHAYEPFDVPKIYLRGEGRANEGRPTVIGSLPVVFEGIPIGEGGDAPVFDFGAPGGGQRPAGPASLPVLTAAEPGLQLPAGLGPGLSSTGLSMNALAFGDMTWLATDEAARFALSRNYWSPMVPQPGNIFLDRLGNTWPRNLEPKYTTNPAPWLRRGFTDAELAGIPDMVRRYNAGTATADEIALLRRAAELHIGGSSPGAPFASYMTPGHNLTWGANKAYRVRVAMPNGNVIDVSVPNAFNEYGALPDITNVEEAEFLAVANNEGRIVSVERALSSGEAGFLLRHSNKIRWGGRILIVAGLAVSAHRIATASDEERPRVIGEEAGGLALGAAGTSLAVAGCIALGVATGGVGLFLCGLVGGAAGSAVGSAGGGALVEGLQHEYREVKETVNWVVEHDSPGSLMAPGIITPYVMRGGYGGLLRSPADVIRAEERGAGR